MFLWERFLHEKATTVRVIFVHRNFTTRGRTFTDFVFVFLRLWNNRNCLLFQSWIYFFIQFIVAIFNIFSSLVVWKASMIKQIAKRTTLEDTECKIHIWSNEIWQQPFVISLQHNGGQLLAKLLPHNKKSGDVAIKLSLTFFFSSSTSYNRTCILCVLPVLGLSPAKLSWKTWKTMCKYYQ